MTIARMKPLDDDELKMAAEIVIAMAPGHGRPFDKRATALAFCRAAQADAGFRARLAEVHRQLEARRKTNLPAEILAPLAPLFRDLEREAETVLDRSTR